MRLCGSVNKLAAREEGKEKMGRFKLRLDAIDVDSFEVTGSPVARGGVVSFSERYTEVTCNTCAGYPGCGTTGMSGPDTVFDLSCSPCPETMQVGCESNVQTACGLGCQLSDMC